MDKKRERSTNFSKAEARLLVDLAVKYKDILENKKTDAVSNKDKENCWTRISTQFNACCESGVQRTAKTLKMKYEVLKKTTRKKAAQHRSNMYATGGGPSSAPIFDEVDDKILSICSNITGLDARHDCDSIEDVSTFKEKTEPRLPSPPSAAAIRGSMEDFCDEELLTHDNDTELGNTGPIAHEGANLPSTSNSERIPQGNEQGANLLRSKISSCLKSVTKSGVTAKLDKLSEARLELVKLQLEIAKNEMKWKKEEHQLKIELMKKENERKEELHILKKNLLQEQKKDVEKEDEEETEDDGTYLEEEYLED